MGNRGWEMIGECFLACFVISYNNDATSRRTIRMENTFNHECPAVNKGVDEYAERLRNYFTAGCAMTAIAIAKDVGILNVLLTADKPLTTEEIAQRGHLKQRYCREILGALVTARVVQIDSENRKYSVAKDDRKSLAESSICSRYMPYFGLKFAAIKNCFAEDGPTGVRYADYPVAFDIMRETRVFTQDSLLEEFVLSVVPGLPERLEKGLEAAELGCGFGILSNNLAKRYPSTSFTACDVVDDLLVTAQSAADEMGLQNIAYENQNIYSLPESYKDRFDWILVREVIHDLPNPENALCQIYNALKPGGELSLLEVGTTGTLTDNVGNMEACALYTISTFNCVPESFQHPDSVALGSAWNVQTARAMIERVGFTLVREHRDKQEVHYVCRKPRV